MLARSLLIGHILCALLLGQDSWQKSKPFVDAWGERDRKEGGSLAGRSALEQEILGWLDAAPKEVWAFEAAALGLNRLNRNPSALGVIRRYLESSPGDRSLEERVLFFFGNWGDWQDALRIPKKWQDSRGYWAARSQIAQRAKMPDEIRSSLLQLWKRSPAAMDPDGRERHNWAEQLLAAGWPQDAEAIAREAVELKEWVAPPQPGMLSVFHRATLSWVLHNLKREEEALKEMEQAIRTAEQAKQVGKSMYPRYAALLAASGRKAEALAAWEKELAWGSYPEEAKQGWEALANQRISDEAWERVNDLALARLDLNTGGFRDFDTDLRVTDLTSLAGTPIDLKQWIGKTLVIEFWATWCTPCLTLMQQTHDLEHALGGRVAVLLVTVDPLENIDKAKAFVARKGYNGTLARGGQLLQARYGRAIPARFLIDSKGRLRAVEQGYSAPNAAAFSKKLRELSAIN